MLMDETLIHNGVDDVDPNNSEEGVFSKIQIEMKYNYLNVACNIPLDGECCSFLCEHIIHHILYMRQQIPCLFPSLELQINKIKDEAKTKKKRISSKQKSLVKLYETVTRMIDNIIEILCQNVENNMFSILLGNSISNPKEVYIIKFNNSKSWNLNFNNSQKHNLMTNLSKKVIRNIISGGFDCFMTDCKPNLSVFLMARLSNRFSEITSENNDMEDISILNEEEEDDFEQAPQLNLISKPNFNFKLKAPSKFRKDLKQAKKEGDKSINLLLSKLCIIELSDYEMSEQDKTNSLNEIRSFIKVNLPNSLMIQPNSNENSQEQYDERDSNNCWFLIK